MDFLASLIVFASSQGISEPDALKMHQNYCQNLYWQPNAQEKMTEAQCSIYETESEIVKVKSGRY